MGDQIEITTWPKCCHSFFKVSSNGIVFEVKAAGFVGIGLAKQQRNVPSCDYWIGIGCGNRSWICKKFGARLGSRGKEAITPNILSSDVYRRFWISWHNDVIQLGIAGQGKAIIACGFDTSNLNHVTFSVMDGGVDTAHWKFDLPPILESPYRPVTGGELHWVPTTADSPVPLGAVIGGYEYEPLYIVRVEQSGQLNVGKFAPSKKTACVIFNNCLYKKTNFEILCGYDFTWNSNYRDQAGVFIAGYSKADLRYIYVGRTVYKGHLIPGMADFRSGSCMLVSDNKRLVLGEIFDVLIIPETNLRSSSNHSLTQTPMSIVNWRSPNHALPPPQMSVVDLSLTNRALTQR